MAFCKKCGKQNPDTAKFCIGCGNPLKIKHPETNTVLPNQDDRGINIFVAPKKNKKTIRLISGIILLLAICTSAYFLFFNKKKDLPILMVLPESLKLRSSMSETGEDNVVRSASYGTSVKIIDSTDGWYKVETDGQKGYMHSRYLVSAKDFYETDAILKSAGSIVLTGGENITESRFKKSLLRYFRTHNYIANIPADVKEIYFKDANLTVKQDWRIKSYPAEALAFIKGNFTFSSKKGIAVIIQSITDPSKQKLLVFNYDDAENETGVNEFDEPNIESIGLLKKGNFEYIDKKGHYIKPDVDVVSCSIPGEDAIYDGRGFFFYVFRNGKMEKDFVPHM